jgi:hypothetical protein
MTSGVVLDRAALVPVIAEQLSKGVSLSSICRSLGISRRTVQKWRAEDEEIEAVLQEARDDGYDDIAYRMRETARGNGDSTGDVARDKLIIDSDKWLLGKWDKKRYGERTAIDHSSTDGTMTPKGLNDFYAGLNDPAKSDNPDA